MTYQVLYTDSFMADVDEHIDYLMRQRVGLTTIDAWFGRLYKVIDSLDEWPLRFPVDEHESERTGRETRKINFGDYVVFYRVDLDRRRVDVMGFVHGAKRDLK